MTHQEVIEQVDRALEPDGFVGWNGRRVPAFRLREGGEVARPLCGREGGWFFYDAEFENTSSVVVHPIAVRYGNVSTARTYKLVAPARSPARPKVRWH